MNEDHNLSLRIDDLIPDHNPLIISEKIPVIKESVLVENSNLQNVGTSNELYKSKERGTPISSKLRRNLFNSKRIADIEPYKAESSLGEDSMNERQLKEWISTLIDTPKGFNLNGKYFKDG